MTFDYRNSDTVTFVRECHRFFSEAVEEAVSARKKFPIEDDENCDNPTIVALMEEVGELAKAMMQEDTGRVRSEALQVAAMAVRAALEGDPTLDRVRSIRVPSGGRAGVSEGGTGQGPVEALGPHAHTVERLRAWSLYCYETSDDVTAGDSWEELPHYIQENYLFRVRCGERAPGDEGR